MSKIDNLYLYVHFLMFEIFSGIVGLKSNDVP